MGGKLRLSVAAAGRSRPRSGSRGPAVPVAPGWPEPQALPSVQGPRAIHSRLDAGRARDALIGAGITCKRSSAGAAGPRRRAPRTSLACPGFIFLPDPSAGAGTARVTRCDISNLPLVFLKTGLEVAGSSREIPNLPQPRASAQAQAQVRRRALTLRRPGRRPPAPAEEPRAPASGPRRRGTHGHVLLRRGWR